MLLPQFIRESSSALEALYPPQEARSLVLRLCSEVLGTQSYTHIVEPSYEIPSEQVGVLQDAISRLLDGEPLQYITGWQEFCGRRFRVTPDVLIPRPETEMIVDLVIKHLTTARRPAILDLCTGSGCIAWSIAMEMPGAEVTGVDISDAALHVAASQFAADAEAGQAAPRFIKADVLQAPEVFPGGPFDVITANPPYILESEKAAMHRNVLEHEPKLALFVPDNDPLLFYRAIANWAQRFLKPGAWGFAEINETLGEQTAALFRQAGMQNVKKVLDFFGKERFVSFQKPQ